MVEEKLHYLGGFTGGAKLPFLSFCAVSINQPSLLWMWALGLERRDQCPHGNLGMDAKHVPRCQAAPRGLVWGCAPGPSFPPRQGEEAAAPLLTLPSLAPSVLLKHCNSGSPQGPQRSGEEPDRTMQTVSLPTVLCDCPWPCSKEPAYLFNKLGCSEICSSMGDWGNGKADGQGQAGRWGGGGRARLWG